MSESQGKSDQEYFCSDAVRGKTFAVTNGPDADALCKALGEAVDARHPDWPMGYRTVDFRVFVSGVGFKRVSVAVTGLRWLEQCGKSRCTLYGFVDSKMHRHIVIDYTLDGPDHKASNRTGRITF
jgi:hypothetical protein